jgi:anti-anti-sigma factor
MAAQKLKAKGGALRLCGLAPMILEVFEVSGFSKLIPIYKDRAEGLAGW